MQVPAKIYDKRERIMASADELFRAFGVRHSTMEQIAKHAQVGKGTLYLYFEDKDALFGAVMERKWKAMKQEANDQLPKDKSIVEQLLSILQTVTAYRARDPFFQKIQLEYVHYHTPEIEKGLQTAQTEAVYFVEELVQAGIRQGELPDVPSRMLAFLLVKAFASFTYEWPEQFEPVDSSQFAELFKILLNPGQHGRGADV